jgi:hypothetical protein
MGMKFFFRHEIARHGPVLRIGLHGYVGCAGRRMEKKPELALSQAVAFDPRPDSRAAVPYVRNVC